jgi:signal transduction histidine kinase
MNIKLSLPHIETLSIEDQRRRLLLNVMVTGVIIIAASSLVMVIVTELLGLLEHTLLIYLSIPALLSGSLVVYIMNRYGKVYTAGIVFLIILTAAISLADTPELLVAGRSLFFFVIPIMMSSFLLPAYTSFIVASLITIEHLFIWNRIEIDQLFSPFGMVGFFLFAMITWLAARSLEVALNTAYEVNENLDHLVAERTQELAEANVQLASANERLQELDELKTKFVSDVTHELRTPISNVSIYLEMAENSLSKVEDLPEKVVGFLKVLRGETARLIKLITDILDVSRLEKGISEIEFQSVDANQIVREVFKANRLKAEAKGLEISFETSMSSPQLMADPDQLTQVFTNLIANATNYTSEGSIRISTSQTDDGYFDFCIQDTGMGIKREDFEHLFERFYRGSQASLSTIPGSGLGLAISKEIIEAHNGNFDIQSEVGIGTVFHVYFPLDNQVEIQS